MFERLKFWAWALKRDSRALWIAGRDPRTPIAAKMLAAAVAAYAFSPIDLIPDFIPVLGYLDDLVILPFGIAVTIKLIPIELMTEFRQAALKLYQDKQSRIAPFIIAVIWMCVGFLLGKWLWEAVIG